MNQLKLKLPPRPFWVFFLISTACFMVWFMAFSPGLFTPDSIMQWRQIVEWDFYDWHPYFHTLYIGFFQKVFKHPGSIALFQVLMFSSCFSYIFNYFWQRKVHKALIIIPFIIFCLSIPVGLYAVTVWKDVAFTFCAVMLAFFLSIRVHKLEWTKGDYLLFIILMIGSLFFRHNGIIYVGLVPLIIWFYTSVSSKQKQYLIFFTLVIFVLFKYTIPHQINLREKPSWMNMQLAFSSNAHFHHFSRYTKVSPLTQEWLGNVNLPPVYFERYNPFNSDYLTSQEEFFNYDNYHNPVFWETMQQEFFRYNLWHNLPLFLGQRLQIFIATTNGYGMTHAVESFPNEFFIQVRPLSQTLNTKMRSLLSSIQGSLWHYVVWNSFIPLLLVIVLWCVSWFQKRKHFQLFGFIILIQAPLLFVFNTAPDFRYSYIFYLGALIALPLFFLDTDHLLDKELLDIINEDEDEAPVPKPALTPTPKVTKKKTTPKKKTKTPAKKATPKKTTTKAKAKTTTKKATTPKKTTAKKAKASPKTKATPKKAATKAKAKTTSKKASTTKKTPKTKAKKTVSKK